MFFLIHKKITTRRFFGCADRTGLEPATSAVTGQRSNQTELPVQNLDNTALSGTKK